jgi:hypothetical protein
MAATIFPSRVGLSAIQLAVRATELRRMDVTARQPGVMEALLRLAERFDRVADTRRKVKAEGPA